MKNHRSETETRSLIEEQGRRDEPDPRERQGEVPVQATSAGVVLPRGTDESTPADEDREAAERREQRGE